MKRKLIDDKGRIFGVLNVLDFIVIVMVVLLILGIFLKLFVIGTTKVNTDEENIQITIIIKNVRQYTVDALEVGDIMYESDLGGELGEITDILVEDASASVELADGSVVEAGAEGYYDITITITTTCEIDEGKYILNDNYEINVNSYRALYTKYSTFSATVLSIEEIESETETTGAETD